MVNRWLTSAQREIRMKEGELWHRRMGHVSAPYVHKLPHVTEGVRDVICKNDQNNCQICSFAKMTRKSCDEDREPASRELVRLFMLM